MYHDCFYGYQIVYVYVCAPFNLSYKADGGLDFVGELAVG